MNIGQPQLCTIGAEGPLDTARPAQSRVRAWPHWTRDAPEPTSSWHLGLASSLTKQVQSQEWHNISPEGAFSSLQPSPSGQLEWEKATWFIAGSFSNPKGARSPNIPPLLGPLPRSDSTTCFRKSNQQPACGFQGSEQVEEGEKGCGSDFECSLRSQMASAYGYCQFTLSREWRGPGGYAKLRCCKH